MIRTIMVPLDGSEFAEQALPIAEALAASLGAALRLVTVHDPKLAWLDPAEAAAAMVDLGDSLREEEESYLQRKTGELAARGRQVAHAIRKGEAAAELVKYAEAEKADLIVMTTHGRGGVSRFWLGSVADRLVRQSDRPVLLLRPERAPATLDALLAEVLIPLDGSARAESVLRPVDELVRQAGGRLHFLSVVVPPFIFAPPPAPRGAGLEGAPVHQRKLHAYRYLRRLAQPLRESGRQVTTQVDVATDAAAEIVEHAARHDVQLVAIATHGRGGIARWALGGVADKVVRAGTVAVLVFPTHGSGGSEEMSADYRAALHDPDPIEPAQT